MITEMKKSVWDFFLLTARFLSWQDFQPRVVVVQVLINFFIFVLLIKKNYFGFSLLNYSIFGKSRQWKMALCTKFLLRFTVLILVQIQFLSEKFEPA
jgi:hypothetical protein